MQDVAVTAVSEQDGPEQDRSEQGRRSVQDGPEQDRPEQGRSVQDALASGSSRSRLVSGVVILLAIAGLAAVTLLDVSPPAVVTADAPADVFSADRAFTHVQQIGQQQHVTGSAAATRVREYITTTLTDMGGQPQIQEAVAGTSDLSGPYGMAPVHNVVAVLKGTASTGPVVMVAHYDSVQVSYGGNDDGAGVSTLLETARAVLAGPPPRNDIVFLFTDAEEACICGADAFVTQNPIAANRGVALNFESRGANGPAIMFETSAGNADVVGMYGSAVPDPVATSFAVEVYRILPNDTDFTPFRESGRFTGLNTAYIDGSAVYHGPGDTPANMDRSSLQQHGANALALAHTFGAADIAALAMPSAGDSTYFPALGTLVCYPGWLVWPLAVLAVLAVLALAALARRRRLVSWSRAAAGLGLATIPLLLAPVAAQLFWALLVLVRPGYANMMDPWRPGWFRICVLAVVATVLLTWYGLLRRRIGVWNLAVGALGWLALIGVVLAVVAPGGSYLAAVPALACAVGGIVAVTVTPTWVRLTSLTVGAGVAVIILVPTVFLFFPALGLETGATAALFAVLLGMALLPIIELLYPAPARTAAPEQHSDAVQDGSRGRWWAAAPALVTGALAVLSVAAGLEVDQFDAVHPAPSQLAYALDTDTGRARWVSSDAKPGEWVSQFVSTPEDLHDAFGMLNKGVRTGPAEAADLPPPQLSVLSDSTAGGVRTLAVNIRAQRDARLIYLDLPDSTVLRATVQGQPVPKAEFADRFAVVFHAPPTDGVTVVLDLIRADPARIRVMDGSDGLADLPGFRPRPAGVGIQGSHSSELVLVAKTYTV